jgi:capsular polysaccharide biosynthesis protein
VPHLRATQLVAPGLPSDIVRNPPWVSAFLRDRLKAPSLARVPGRHVFITRGKAKHNRSITNEDDVLEVLDRHGFESLDAGELSVAEQIRTFAEVDVLVAPHGAALANLAFCSPGATVLELFPATTVVADYWKMASGVPGLEYRYLQGVGAAETSRRGSLVVSDITVDVPQLTAMLDEVLSSRGRA